MEASKRFARIALNREEDPTVRVQNAFKAVEFAIATCTIKYEKIGLKGERSRSGFPLLS